MKRTEDDKIKSSVIKSSVIKSSGIDHPSSIIRHRIIRHRIIRHQLSAIDIRRQHSNPENPALKYRALNGRPLQVRECWKGIAEIFVITSVFINHDE